MSILFPYYIDGYLPVLVSSFFKAKKKKTISAIIPPIDCKRIVLSVYEEEIDVNLMTKKKKDTNNCYHRLQF